MGKDNCQDNVVLGILPGNLLSCQGFHILPSHQLSPRKKLSALLWLNEIDECPSYYHKQLQLSESLMANWLVQIGGLMGHHRKHTSGNQSRRKTAQGWSAKCRSCHFLFCKSNHHSSPPWMLMSINKRWNWDRYQQELPLNGMPLRKVSGIHLWRWLV